MLDLIIMILLYILIYDGTVLMLSCSVLSDSGNPMGYSPPGLVHAASAVVQVLF